MVGQFEKHRQVAEHDVFGLPRLGLGAKDQILERHDRQRFQADIDSLSIRFKLRTLRRTGPIDDRAGQRAQPVNAPLPVEICRGRAEKRRQADLAASGRGTLEQMLSKIKEGEAVSLPVVVKSDVHGSLEAINGALEKLGNDEVNVRVLHSAVGGVNESDVTLARASEALIIAFNVRANAQARDLARRDGVEIRYYSIIYEVIDEVKSALEGMLSPDQNEEFLGYAEIREVFNITKVGKVAGCMVTEGKVKRGAGVRLLRDDVVIHQGKLKTLRRFKDEVREVQQGYECGMAFESYQDIQVGDRIECYEVVEVARTL